jgi:hypothetical protein
MLQRGLLQKHAPETPEKTVCSSARAVVDKAEQGVKQGLFKGKVGGGQGQAGCGAASGAWPKQRPPPTHTLHSFPPFVLGPPRLEGTREAETESPLERVPRVEFRSETYFATRLVGCAPPINLQAPAHTLSLVHTRACSLGLRVAVSNQI